MKREKLLQKLMKSKILFYCKIKRGTFKIEFLKEHSEKLLKKSKNLLIFQKKKIKNILISYKKLQMEEKLNNKTFNEENIPLIKKNIKNYSVNYGKKNRYKQSDEEIETEITLSLKESENLDNFKIYDFNINSFIYDFPSKSFFREKDFAKESAFFIYLKISMLLIFFVFMTLGILKFTYKN